MVTMAVERLVSPTSTPVLDPIEQERNWSLRPRRIAEYIGQPQLIEKLSIAIQAAQGRGDPMEHVLLHGPPGLGKTTLAHVIGQEMGTRVHLTSGPALTKPGDLVSVLTQLGERDILFIDEIHRLPIAVEEFIYPAMEDFRIDVRVEGGMHSKTIQVPVKPFTLIGATTRAGLVSGPMLSRFGIQHSLAYYAVDELVTILNRSAELLNVRAKAGALPLVAQRSRGTPRIANRLLRRVRDFAQVKGDGTLTPELVGEALRLEGVDASGLDDLDRSYMRVLAKVYSGGPVGPEAIAATLNHDVGTLVDIVEPYLLQIGFLARTKRGRALTKAGATHIGMPHAAAVGGELYEGEQS
ncbi:MAG: Holliday junction branch migration DNA helicase RuvB [Phycisphaerales bacterium]|nr:Holliday junction branch migration DNA helicase RuvB [Phycisphaerales bacterium]